MPIVNQVTFSQARPGQSQFYRVAQADFNIRAGQGRMGVILRRRPCFFAGIDRVKATSTAPFTAIKRVGSVQNTAILAGW
jgi:hypothetical protein